MEKKQIQKILNDPYEVAYRYFNIVSAANGIHLTHRELQLLAFISVRKSLPHGIIKLQFVEKFGSSINTVGNMLGQLMDLKFIIKENKKYSINPVLKVSEDNLLLVINLCPEKQ